MLLASSSVIREINVEDFKHLRDEFQNLEVLDISNAEIKMYTGKGGTYPDKIYVYMPNFIPAYAFCRVWIRHWSLIYLRQPDWAYSLLSI